MSIRQSIARILKVSLLFLFIGYYSGITLFYHVHTVRGEVIVHSHFYRSEANDKSPAKKHTHPLSAYNLIQELNKISSEELVVVMPYQRPLLIAQSILRCFVCSDKIISTRFHLPPRAPPGNSLS